MYFYYTLLKLDLLIDLKVKNGRKLVFNAKKIIK